MKVFSSNAAEKPDPEQFLLLQKKYPTTGPRYTSYPTALELDNSFSEHELLGHIQSSNDALIPSDLSLYFHMPFCRHLCFYCGCNRIVTKNKQKGVEYLDYLTREIKMMSRHVDQDRKVMQLHLGGGTPSFFSLEQLRSLLHTVSQHFLLLFNSGRDYSIEIDPRTVDESYIRGLAALGFNRISIGVQDCNPDVQKAIHREQDSQHIANLVAEAKKSGLQSINLDLVYGLPKQTAESFKETIQFVASLEPDRISAYHYAHMPTQFPAQRRILESDLPDSAAKLSIQQNTIDMLSEAGYDYIGMDHFAKKDDVLSKALVDGSIQRNFQGYTTHRKSELLGFGVSAIGDIGGCLYQNEKSLEGYYAKIDNQRLPIARGLSRTQDDTVRQRVIMQLMCKGHIDKNCFYDESGEKFDDYFRAEKIEISKLKGDGLIEETKDSVWVTSLGRFMIRNIALVFDRYRHQKRPAATLSRIH